MGVLPVPRSPARAARAERQLVFVFVPAESLRRVCVVPLEMLAGVLAVVGLALRSLPSEDGEPRRAPGSRTVTQQEEQSSASSMQSIPANASDLKNADTQREPSSTSSTQTLTMCAPADATSGSSSRVDQSRGDVALSGTEVADQNRLNEERASACNDGHEPIEEETPRAYGPFWPCPVHPPNQPLRFCDLTEDEQEEIMDADLEAYRSAWRPGDLKYIRWNPDPAVADEDQGREAFHDENYEFFWWTPTAYPTTREKYVFYAGNITKYPVHGPVYCPLCDRHVWESLPQRSERLNLPKQSSKAPSQSGQDSREVDLSQGNGCPRQSAFLSGQSGSPPYPERTHEYLRQSNMAYEFEYPQVGDPHQEPIYLTQFLTPSQLELKFAQDSFTQPTYCAVPVVGNRRVEYGVHKAVQTMSVDSVVNPRHNCWNSNEDSAAHTAHDQNGHEKVRKVASKLERLCIATTHSSEGQELGETCLERPVDVDCLERLLLELIENSGNEDCHDGIDQRTSGEKTYPTIPKIQGQGIKQDEDSESGRLEQDEAKRSNEEHQVSKSAKNQTPAGASRKRRNRRSRKLAQLKSNGFLEPKSGPSGRCGCKCGACKGCTGRSQPDVADKIRLECRDLRGQVIGVSLPSLRVAKNDTKPKNATAPEMQHGRDKAGEASHKSYMPQDCNKNDQVADVPASGSADVTDRFIDISFGDIKPVRIYQKTKSHTTMPIRPFYEPQDRSMTPGMDTALGEGCMSRLMASGLDVDDFIITEGRGRRAKTMFLWPGPPTKPCIDLVGQRHHLTNFCVPSLSETIPAAPSTCLEDRNRNVNDSESGKACERPVSDESQEVDAEQKESSQPSCTTPVNNEGGHAERQTQNEKRDQSHGAVSSSSTPPSESHGETTDVEPASPHSSEDRKRTPQKTRKRFRWTLNKIWKNKEPSTDPSSPFSTFESGSFSSDEGQLKKKMQCLTTPDGLSMSLTGRSTGISMVAISQEKSSELASQELVSVSAGDQLRNGTSKMAARRRLREVRRAKRTVQHLRLVRRSSLNAAKSMRTQKIARVAITRPLYKSRSKPTRAINESCAKETGLPAASTPETSAHSFRQQLVSVFGPTTQPHLSRRTGIADGPEAQHAAIAADAGNIMDVCSTVTRIAEGTSVREVEVELLPKYSPASVRHQLGRSGTEKGLVASGKAESLIPQVETNARRNTSQKKVSENVRLSPHSKADGLWNGRRPEDYPGPSNASGEPLVHDVQGKTGQSDTNQQAGQICPSRSAMFDNPSYHSISDETDFARDFEESELGKLMALSVEVDRLEQEDSHQTTGSQALEETGTENTDQETSGELASTAVMKHPRRLTSRGKPLESLKWDPIWVQSPPLSPRSRLWAIFNRLPGSQKPPQPRHTSPFELLPGAAEASPADADHPAIGSPSTAAPRLAPGTTWPPERPALGLRPTLLITSAQLQPEDNLLAHGDPARPWVRSDTGTEKKTLADLIVGRQARIGMAAIGTVRR